MWVLFIWHSICTRTAFSKSKKLNYGTNLRALGIQLLGETGSGEDVIVGIIHIAQTGQFLYLEQWLRKMFELIFFSLLTPILLCDSHPIVTPG